MSNFYIGDDMTVSIAGLKDCYSGSYLNSATVTGQLKTADGTNVGSSFTLDYQAATDGNYMGVLDAVATSQMTEGTNYIIELTITQSDYDGKRRIKEMAKYHSYTP